MLVSQTLQQCRACQKTDVVVSPTELADTSRENERMPQVGSSDRKCGVITMTSSERN